MPRIRKPGRPAGEPTTVMRVPVDKIDVVEKILGRNDLAASQTAHIMLRVPTSKVKTIRKAIKSC